MTLTEKTSPPHAVRRAVRLALVWSALLVFGAGRMEAQISVSTLAGVANSLGSSDSANPPARFNSPQGVAVDVSSGARAGTVYVADTNNHTIRAISPAGVVTTLAGVAGSGGAVNSTDGSGATARFRAPQSLVVDLDGTALYVADTGNNAIRKIVIATGATTTVAGLLGISGSADSTDGSGASARFSGPAGLAIDGPGANLYIADLANHAIRRVVIATGATTTIAGSLGNLGTADGTGSAARFFLPGGIAADATNLYVADGGNHAIRRIVLATNAVSTLAGLVGTSGSTDGAGAAARFFSPASLTVRGANLYVADTQNHVLRQIVLASGLTTTIAGTAGVPGNTDATGNAARFNTPAGLAVDSAGNFYVADTINHTIRKGGPTAAPVIGSQPADQSVAIGATVTFAVTATGNPTPTYQWQIQSGGSGAFSNLANNSLYDGVTTPTLTITNANGAMSGDKFRCVITNAAPGTVTSNAATLTVNQPPTFTSAATAQFAVGVAGSVQVTASGSPAPTFAITAGANPSGIGVTLSPSGVLSGTPTGNAGSPYVFSITATSAAGSVVQLFTLTVQAGPSITTSPADVTVAAAANATFSVAAAGIPATFTYQWFRAPASDPTNFASLGTGDTTYTGTQTATLTVVAATVAMNGDRFRCVVSNGYGLPATSAAATLAVTQPPVFTSVASTTFAANQASTYQVTATGTPAPTFSITAGTSPASLGITLSTAGLLSGTATATTGSPLTFTITATNSAGTTTQSFTLTLIPVGALPSFTTQPTNQSATIGGTATFTVVGSGLPAPTYQWQRQPANTTGFVNLTNDSIYGGVTTPTLTVTGVATGMTGDQFQCVATNTGGSGTSTAASLTVNVGMIITTLAGQAGTAGSTNATGGDARFNNPSAIAVDSAGNLYVADTTNCTIRKVTAAGVVTTFAGVPGVPGSTDGNAQVARFNGPSGVAVDGAGNVYVADTFNHTIRVITSAGLVSTLAGAAGVLGSTDDTGAAARFAYPTGVAVASSGAIYVADSFNHTIRLVTPAGVVTTFAGLAGARGATDGLANLSTFTGQARFNTPSAVAVDPTGNVYVADSFNHTIRMISSVSNVTTLAGLAGTPGAADGTGGAARFTQPSGLAVDSSGNVFVADTFSHVIRKITSGGVVTTIAGLAFNSGSADGTTTAVRFTQPTGIAVDSSGNVFIADTRNNTLRRNAPIFSPIISSQPRSRAVVVGQTATFTVAASGSPTPTYQWQRQAAAATSFTNLVNDATYSGVTTTTLSIANVTAAMEGDKFRCIVANFISPDAVTNTVTLGSNLVAPVFTSANSTTFTVGQAGSFTVAASGTPAPTFSVSGLPAWATFNATTGVLSGTPPDATGTPLALTFTADNSATATQNFTLNLFVPPVAPAITTQPTNIGLNRGGNATFSVTATGSAPLSYQWSRNGTPVSGATNATLTLTNVQPAVTGSYTVRVSNSAGSATSVAAALALNLAPVITTQPRSQTVLAGSDATLVVVTNTDSISTFQWRLNGSTVSGATSATLLLANVQPGSAGNYDVVVTNQLGTVTSSLAQLIVTGAAVTPSLTSVPTNRVALLGTTATFTVAATGVPAPSFQWRKDGTPLPGATNATLTFASVQGADTANYDVVVSSNAGSVTSPAAALKTIARSYAGIYVGTLGGASSPFALLVREDNSGVLLGFVSGAGGGNVSNLFFNVSDTGEFASTLNGVTVAGAISSGGAVAGSVTGAISTTLSGAKAPDVGAAQALAGFYQAGVAGGSGSAYAIVAANGQVCVVTQAAGGVVDGGAGILDSANRTTITTALGTIAVTLAADGSAFTVVGTRSGQASNFSGASEAIIAAQRLANISTRARVDTGANVAIAGFVITGSEAKPVLIRAIGPTLASFGVTTALAAPKLDLYRGATLLASNVGWTNGGNTAAIAAAATRVAAFPLATTSADSAIFITLAPGNYTAQVSAASGAAGAALIEAYDLSAAVAGQKLFNISTRATVGSGDATLIAGIAVSGTAPKRVLIRAIGPGLAQFGLSGVLAVPQLQLVKDGAVLASNAGVGSSPDFAAIAAASVQVGAFPLPAGSADCALLVNLAPGNYSALVTGLSGTTGIAIVEVYEVP